MAFVAKKSAPEQKAIFSSSESRFTRSECFIAALDLASDLAATGAVMVLTVSTAGEQDEATEPSRAGYVRNGAIPVARVAAAAAGSDRRHEFEESPEHGAASDVQARP